MTTKALFVRLEAKPGKENEVAKFLRDGQGLVQQEPATTAWFGIRLGPSTFAIFDISRKSGFGMANVCFAAVAGAALGGALARGLVVRVRALPVDFDAVFLAIVCAPL